MLNGNSEYLKWTRMKMKIDKLINYLEKFDKDEQVIVQIFTSDATLYEPEQFDKIANYLDYNEQFGEDTTELFLSWMSEANSIINELEDCIHCDGKGYDIHDNDCDYCDGTGKDNGN